MNQFNTLLLVDSTLLIGVLSGLVGTLHFYMLELEEDAAVPKGIPFSGKRIAILVLSIIIYGTGGFR